MITATIIFLCILAGGFWYVEHLPDYQFRGEDDPHWKGDWKETRETKTEYRASNLDEENEETT